MKERNPYTVHNKKSLTNVEINIDEDIKKDIEDFCFSKKDLEDIKTPSDLDDIINEPFLEDKKEKKSYIISWIVDLSLVFILILPIVGVYNPNIFSKLDTVYPFFVKVHNFLDKDNIIRMLGGGSNSENLKDAKPTVVVKAKDVKKPKSNIEELELIHSLVNSLIRAEYKWECTEVTPNTIKKAISGVDYLQDEYHRIYFRSNLQKWQEGDFSNAVEVHNKVWSILKGNIGEAYALDEENISKIKQK
ncbi:MAG: DUF6241 domain-containing protein, partial [Intestinibacter sp.]